MTQKKQLTLMNYAAILSIFLFSGAGSFMNAAVQTMMSLFQLYNGKVATAQTVTFFSTLLIAALSLGNFISVYFINFCHTIFQRSSDIESTYFGSRICYIILGVLALVLKVSPEYLEKENK